jgi:hypothetical protein
MSVFSTVSHSDSCPRRTDIAIILIADYLVIIQKMSLQISFHITVNSYKIKEVHSSIIRRKYNLLNNRLLSLCDKLILCARESQVQPIRGSNRDRLHNKYLTSRIKFLS